MDVAFEASFARDLKRVRNKALLRVVGEQVIFVRILHRAVFVA